MGQRNSEPQVTELRAHYEPVAQTQTGRALYQCLVVSPREECCAQFWAAATQGGWNATSLRDAEEAARIAARIRFQLAIVDLQRRAGATASGFCELSERLARDPELLLVICGNEGDTTEEIWAHQIGTWLYLSGVDDDSDVAMVCAEARVAVEKLAGQGSASEGATRRDVLPVGLLHTDTIPGLGP